MPDQARFTCPSIFSCVGGDGTGSGGRGSRSVLWHMVMVWMKQQCVNDSCSRLTCNEHLNVRNLLQSEISTRSQYLL